MLKLLAPWFGWGYLLFMALWLAVRSFTLDSVWWISLFNYIAIYLFIPLPVLLVGATWFRRWLLLAGLSVILAVFGSFYGALFLPSLPQVTSYGQDITVMTFNLRLGNRDTSALSQVIRAEQPDIIGIQEFVPGLLQPLILDLANDYPYSALAPGRPEAAVVGILSKFPISENEFFALPGFPEGIHLETGEELVPPGPRFGIWAKVQVNNQLVQVISVDGLHNLTLQKPVLKWAASENELHAQKIEEIDLLEQKFRQDNAPFILLCACNLAETSESYTLLSTFAFDSFRERGWGFGHNFLTRIGPLAIATGPRLDYVWRSQEFMTLEARVGRNAGDSNHLPVIVKLVLPE